MPPEKAELRRTMRALLREPRPARLAQSHALCAALARHPAYVAARVVALFDPMPSEPAVDLLWALAPRRFVYPRIAGETLELVEVRKVGELEPVAGRRFREPRNSEDTAFPPDMLDLVLVPGLAFTRSGERLGRGGGYYDRLLAALPARVRRLGVCFEMQVVSELPVEPYDMRVEAVVTEDDYFF